MIIEKLPARYVLQTADLLQKLIPYPIDPDYAVQNYETMQHRDDCCVFIARDEDTLLGTVSGFCCRGLGGNFLAIEDLIVQEGIRGSGIGSKLMAAVEEFGRQTHCDYAFLVSSGFRKQAHRFYEKIGYTEDVRGFRKSL